MQEDIENRTVMLIVSAGKFTGRHLYRSCQWLLREMEKGRKNLQSSFKPEKGSVKDLMKSGDAQSIPVSGDSRDMQMFDRYARRHKVKYEVRKVEKGKYHVYFKAPQANDLQACLADYTKYMTRRDKGKTLDAEIKKGKEKIAKEAKEKAKSQVKDKLRGERRLREVGRDVR